jgi:beta-glucosidase-like glycosyl hydrolase
MTDDVTILREAAQKLRAHGTRAWPGRWEWAWCDVDQEWQVVVDHEDGLMHVANAENEETAAWIALVSPALAEPLARWLDEEAHAIESFIDGRSDVVSPSPAALAVARVITRETT